jgi:hypothetical protein
LPPQRCHPSHLSHLSSHLISWKIMPFLNKVFI